MSFLFVTNWNLRTYCLDPTPGATLAQLKQTLSDRIGLHVEAFRLTQNGKQLHDPLDSAQVVRVELRNSGLKGGKGGFGSLLRSMKPKSKGDENFDSCRDLSGRRLRHVNNEQRLRDWQAKNEEEEKYVEEELKEYHKHKRD